MIPAIPALAVRREREKNKFNCLVSPSIDGICIKDNFETVEFTRTYACTPQAYRSFVSSFERERRQRFLIYTAGVMLTTGLIVLSYGILIGKSPLQIIGGSLVLMSFIIFIYRFFTVDETDIYTGNDRHSNYHHYPLEQHSPLP